MSRSGEQQQQLLGEQRVRGEPVGQILAQRADGQVDLVGVELGEQLLDV